MAKWHRLREWLETHGDDRVVLDFDQLAEILGDEVPASATRYRSVFWSNTRGGAYARYWLAAGYRTQLRGLDVDEVAFVRDQAPETLTETDRSPRPARHRPLEGTRRADVVLVGCVKTKAEAPAPARDLYRSELFQRRREYAEASGAVWGILSAEHGLVWPDEVLEPYDRYLEEQPADYRQQWGRRVVARLNGELAPLEGKRVELHASAAYVEPIRRRLQHLGIDVDWPFEGRRFGQHLSWYAFSAALPPAGAPTPADDPPTEEGDGVAGPQAGGGIAWEITDLFWRGELDLSGRADAPAPGWEAMPEVVVCAVLRERGADDVSIRRVCTFVMAMDRARDADMLWQRSVSLFDEHPWVFDPFQVAHRSLTELADVLRRAGVSQRHATDVAAWRSIAESLLDPHTAPAISTAIDAGRGDALELLDEVAAETAEGTPRFPLLRGPKIAPVWVRILAYPGAAVIDRLDRLPVGVDVQVRKVTEYLGVADTHGRPLPEIREPLQQLWLDEATRSGTAGPDPLAGTPAALDPALWFYGKWGCTRCERQGRRQPISALCRHCRFEQTR